MLDLTSLRPMSTSICTIKRMSDSAQYNCPYLLNEDELLRFTVVLVPLSTLSNDCFFKGEHKKTAFIGDMFKASAR